MSIEHHVLPAYQISMFTEPHNLRKNLYLAIFLTFHIMIINVYLGSS